MRRRGPDAGFNRNSVRLGWPHVVPAPLVVGFDLDMTLIDTRPGFAATLQVLADGDRASALDVDGDERAGSGRR